MNNLFEEFVFEIMKRNETKMNLDGSLQHKKVSDF